MSTPHPYEKQILELVNPVLQSSVDPLSRAMDASYYVMEVSFLPGPGQIDLTIFSIEIRCECALNGSCCNVEHTFVVLTKAMEANGAYLVALVPDTIKEFQVFCCDHRSQIGTISVPWQRMREYLLGQIDGYQLGGTVHKNPTPTPEYRTP